MESRQPSGTPVGGQFQALIKAEPSIRLTPDVAVVAGIRWDRSALDVGDLHPRGTDRALARLAARFKTVVWDASKLEGNPFTLPEVATLIDGVTVGGHNLRDEREVLSLVASQRELDRLVAAGEFVLDKATSDRFNARIDVDSIETGAFRGEGSVSGGGHVDLGEAGEFSAPPTEPGGANLRRIFDDGLAELEAVEHPVERGIAYFAFATYYQFYFNGNKRTARAMMNGLLMTEGFDAISVSGRRALEYNEALVDLFKDGDATRIGTLLADVYRVEDAR
jgi:Fic family protein